MKEKIVGIFICFLLIVTIFLPVAETFESNSEIGIGSRCKPALNPNCVYVPEDIDLEDAAFHRSYGRYHGEWWYFEGIFNNGFSIVLGVAICSKGRRGFCLLGLQIYNNTEVGVRIGKSIPMRKFEASEDFPFIELSGKQFIRLDRERYNDTGEWVYNVSLEIEGQMANLQFLGITKGWKGEILKGWYGPVLPKATVNGTLILNGEQVNVSGLGYHEHAWEIPVPIWEWGWYWGKIVSDSFSLLWIEMMQTRWNEQQRVAILSQDQLGYININPENIKFKAVEYTFNNRRIIPTKFILNVTDPDNSIYVNATMETIYIHHAIGLGISHYWRYLISVNGEISYGSSTEMIEDEIQIMELMRWR